MGVISILLASCGINSTIIENPIPQTYAYLNHANFNVIRYESAGVSCKYIFGIGGMSQENLKSSAINELYRKAELKDNQNLVNVNTVISRQIYVGVVVIKTAVASGLIIEFLPDGEIPQQYPFDEEKLTASLYPPQSILVKFDYGKCKFFGQSEKEAAKSVKNFDAIREVAEDEFIEQVQSKVRDYRFLRPHDDSNGKLPILTVKVKSIEKNGQISTDLSFAQPKEKALSTSIDSKKYPGALKWTMSKGMKNSGKKSGSWLKKELKKIKK